MRKYNSSESGQALVLIAVLFVSLLGIVGVAVDSGYSYADRRQAQNAADTSAMAASLAHSSNTAISDSDIQTLVINSTTTNGYSNVAPRSIVTVTRSNAPTGTCDPYIQGVFFQVDITSVNPTFFGGIMGVDNITNHVSARSLSCPPHPAPAGLGNAITALNPSACPGFKVTGNSLIQVTSTTNQGIFVNSSCNEGVNSSQVALSAGGNGTVVSPSVSVVGGIYGQNIFLPTIPVTGVQPITLTGWPTFGAAECGGTVTLATPSTIVDGGITYTVLNPGTYPGTNSAWSNKDFPPYTNIILKPGIYCLDRSMTVQSTGMRINAPVAYHNNEITIVQRVGDTIFRGGSGIWLTAPQSGTYKGLLVYLPQGNAAGQLIVNGNADLHINGSLIAPYSYVELNGGGSVSAPLETQVIADSLKFAGSNNLYLSYNSSYQYQVPIPGMLQLNR